MNRRAFLCSLVIAAGCAHRNVTDLLVLAYVTGQWTGHWSGGGGGDFELSLQQVRDQPKVTGELRLTGAETLYWNGDIVGTIRGEVLTFGRWDGRLRGELTVVAEDEMSGTVTFTPLSTSACCPGAYTHGTKTLKLRRRPLEAASGRQ